MKGVLNTRDLFYSVDTNKLKWDAVKKDYRSPKEMCKTVFDKCIELILLEVIDNNSIFALPTHFGRDSEFYIETVEGEELKKLMQKGQFSDIDVVKSGFKAHRVKHAVERKNGDYFDRIVVLKDPKLQQKLTDNTNSGNIYY